jgi:hypothetical protein
MIFLPTLRLANLPNLHLVLCPPWIWVRLHVKILESRLRESASYLAIHNIKLLERKNN